MKNLLLIFGILICILSVAYLFLMTFTQDLNSWFALSGVPVLIIGLCAGGYICDKNS